MSPAPQPAAGTTALALAHQARAAAHQLALAGTAIKDEALARIVVRVREARGPILAANKRDLVRAKAAGLSAALLDRLALDAERVEAMTRSVDAVRALPDPVGEVTESWRRPNGLEVQRVRIPLGVILMIYEARPNVTTDAAALAIKSGNVVILRGGKEALGTNRAIASAVAAGLADVGLPARAVQLVPTTERQFLLDLLRLEGSIDLAIPRGGAGLIRYVAEHARVPVVRHWQGVCHVFLDQSADPEDAVRIVVNAKTSRPGVCNAAECLLVHAGAAPRLLPAVGRARVAAGGELRAEARARKILDGAGVPAVAAATDDFGREFLDLKMAVAVVDDVGAALAHIARYGSLHTEAIVTRDLLNAHRFTREAEASCVLVNASTRFNDGGELGLGAEIGISTSKLHAFGPMGLRELTTQKLVVLGDGHVR